MGQDLDDLAKMISSMQSLVERKKQEDNLTNPLYWIFENARSSVMRLDEILKRHSSLNVTLTKDEFISILSAWKLLPGIDSVHLREKVPSGHEGYDYAFRNIAELEEFIKNWSSEDFKTKQLSTAYYEIALWQPH